MISRLEVLALLVLLSGPLVPSLEAGTTALELAGFVAPVLAGLYLALGPGNRVAPGRIFLLIPLFTGLAFLSLTHESPSFFLGFSIGIPVFCLAAYVGVTATAEREKWLYWMVAAHVLAGTLLDIYLDTQGWAPSGMSAQNENWELGKRGLNAARSQNGVYLAVTSSWQILNTKRPFRIVLSTITLLLALYHTVTIGQGRGATLTIALAVFLLVVRARKAWGSLLLLSLPVLALAEESSLGQYVDPLRNRFEGQELEQVDRIAHAQVGLRLLERVDVEEWLTGIQHERVFAANHGESIHNAYLDIAINYGIPAAIVFAFMVLMIGLVSARELIRGGGGQAPVGAVVAAMWVMTTPVSGMFWNWRSCVVPALLIGLSMRGARTWERQT